ncbi:ECF transporter S component [Chloroflexota bacterium]
MISRLSISESRALPKVLTYSDIRSYVFTAAFVSLNVAIPRLFHQFHLAGPTFLPMHIFALLAGLLFGYRAGLAVGLITPFASYYISGMPSLTVLPQIVVEITCYGLIAGILREKLRLNVIWSLAGAMMAGRLTLLLTISILSNFGVVYSPLGVEVSPFAAAWSVVKQGWPGILIQITFIPLIVILTEKLLVKKKYGGQENRYTNIP